MGELSIPSHAGLVQSSTSYWSALGRVRDQATLRVLPERASLTEPMFAPVGCPQLSPTSTGAVCDEFAYAEGVSVPSERAAATSTQSITRLIRVPLLPLPGPLVAHLRIEPICSRHQQFCHATYSSPIS